MNIKSMTTKELIIENYRLDYPTSPQGLGGMVSFYNLAKGVDEKEVNNAVSELTNEGKFIKQGETYIASNVIYKDWTAPKVVEVSLPEIRIENLEKRVDTLEVSLTK
jgi:hypothetical protein